MHRKRLFRPFWNMTCPSLADLGGADAFAGLEGLVPDRGRASLLLGFYSEEDIRERLAFYSVATRLAELGYPDYVVRISAADREQQELTLFPRSADGVGEEPLAEVILREVVLSPDPALFPGGKVFPMLVIQWLRLQNPGLPASARSLLPGQKYPGLGLGRKVMEMLVALVQRRNLAGIVNRPEFLHNAWLYSPHFLYLDPVAEGRLRALKRDLSHLSLWQVAWAAQRGFVVEDGCRNFFRWYQGEQLLPNCPALQEHFHGQAYRNAVDEVSAAAHYSLSPATLERL